MGILAAVPYLVLGFASQVSGQLADFLRSHFKISTTTVLHIILFLNINELFIETPLTKGAESIH